MNYQKSWAISTKGLNTDLINGYKILNGTKYIPSGIFRNYLVFIPAQKYVKYSNGSTRIYLWKSNGMWKESIENITKSDSLFTPTFINHYILTDVNFDGRS